MTKVITDKDKIKVLLTKGVENVYPSIDFLRDRLMSGKQLTLYNGIDPTGPSLHIGHGITLHKLAQFQQLGHKIILLIGDFTAMIGDPTDKLATRVKQTKEQVLENAKLYKEQAAHFLDFSGDNPAVLRYNSEWWGKMNFADVLELASNFTVQQMIERDMFENRIKDSKPIYLHEFLYPAMQGYDSVAMDVDGEVGGNDQTFNMLAGRDLMKKLKNKEKFVLSGKLLVDPTGKKMGKSEGNMVAFTDNPSEVFGKVMSWPDSLMPLAYELCTDETMEEGNPFTAKLKLASLIVKNYWGEDESKQAHDNWSSTFSKGEMPIDVPEAKLSGEGVLLVDVLLEQKLVSSKGEFKRLVDEGAISIEGAKITDYNEQAKSGVVRVGKHRFLKIVV